MKARQLAAGALGVLLAVGWTILLVAEAPRHALATGLVVTASESLGARLVALPSVLHYLAGLALVPSMLLAALGALCGSRRAARPLGLCALGGLVVSALVVVGFGALFLPALAGPSSWRPGASAVLELAGAANLLVLHGLLLYLLGTVPVLPIPARASQGV
jgi:hypothetical protein